PLMLTAATSSRPPAAAIAVCSAVHHCSGSTSVPGGCGVEPVRTTAPESASAMTILQLCVEESTPATYLRAAVIVAPRPLPTGPSPSRPLPTRPSPDRPRLRRPSQPRRALPLPPRYRPALLRRAAHRPGPGR